jgi:DNA polymerase-3 subunit delta'
MSGPLAPWQQRVLDGALAALADGRLGHALLLTGAPGMGKEQVARILAQRLLCTDPPAAGQGCGGCRGCRLFRAGTHPDLLQVTFELNDKGDKYRSEIIVDQIRRLGEWFSLTPQCGGAQVALVIPADKLTTSAANALLKTLEEPARDRYLLLVTDRPGRLPATIRSRCQKLEFRPPPREEAESWLRARGHAAEVVRPALDAARGHPALADAWLAEGGLAIRREVASELDAVGSGRRSPVELAQRWLGDDHAALRLRFAAELALDGVAHRMAGTPDPGLTVPADFQKLSAWFERTLRLREQLAVPGLRHDLALAGLLLEWRSLFNPTVVQGARR